MSHTINQWHKPRPKAGRMLTYHPTECFRARGGQALCRLRGQVSRRGIPTPNNLWQGRTGNPPPYPFRTCTSGIPDRYQHRRVWFSRSNASIYIRLNAHSHIDAFTFEHVNDQGLNFFIKVKSSITTPRRRNGNRIQGQSVAVSQQIG